MGINIDANKETQLLHKKATRKIKDDGYKASAILDKILAGVYRDIISGKTDLKSLL